MSSWLDFLVTQGAQLAGTGIASFGETPADYNNLLQQTLLFYPAERGFITLEGPDSEKFLQGQSTCNIAQLTSENALAGAVCTPKGRMICNFLLVRPDNNVLRLQLHAGLVNAARTHLQKFAVFFKTRLADATSERICLAVSGPDARTGLTAVFGTPPDRLQGASHVDDISLVRSGEDTFICQVPADRAPDCWQRLAEYCRPAGQPCWDLLQIRQGLGEVTDATCEEFIPQMLNLQETGGISFRKGCYTGQEVVARMKYLGKLKRRMYRLAASGTVVPAPGTPCYLPGNNQSIGNIVAAGLADEKQVEILAVLTREGSESDCLQIGDRRYPVQTLPLPYEDRLSP